MTSNLIKSALPLILCCFLLIGNSFCDAYAQEQTTLAQEKHSAYTLLEKASNTNEVSEKVKLCEKAIASVKQDENSSLQFQIYFKAGSILYENQQTQLAKQVFTDAIAINNSNIDKNEIGLIESHLGWIASEDKQYKLAIDHFKNALTQYNITGNTEKLGNTYNSVGAMFWYLRNYASALDYFDKVLKIGEQLEDSVLIRKGLTNKGVVLNNLAQYNEALTCFEKALELNQLENDANSRAVLYNNIGNINTELSHFQAAIGNYKEALAIYTHLENRKGISSCYNNLGEVYLKLGNTIQALDNYQTSLQILREEGDSANIVVSYLNIGRAHQNSKEYNKAISYYEKALKLLLSYNDPSLKAEIYLHLGQTLLVNKHYEQSFEYLSKSKELCVSLNEKVLLSQCYNSLSNWHEQHKEYKEAFEYKTLYANIKDEMTDEQALLSSARMEAVYKLLRKEEQISILEQDNIDKTEDIADIKNTRTIYFTISLALLVIVIILALLFQTRRKTTRLLAEKNYELKQLNATKDKFFSIIAHDLKSPFSSLMGFAEMLALNAEMNNNNEVIEYSQIIHNSTKRLLGLVENLLQWSRTQIGTTKYSPSQLDISIQTHNIVSLLRLNAEEKDIVISPKIERNLVAWADENLYNTVLRNLISNAIKFSRVGSIIYVVAGVKNDMIEVSVADSGVGIRQENQEKLFMPDSTFTTKGTFNEKGTGLGLILCKEFVEINKGSIWVKSELEKGSTFYFTVPLHPENE